MASKRINLDKNNFFIAITTIGKKIETIVHRQQGACQRLVFVFNLIIFRYFKKITVTGITGDRKEMPSLMDTTVSFVTMLLDHDRESAAGNSNWKLCWGRLACISLLWVAVSVDKRDISRVNGTSGQK